MDGTTRGTEAAPPPVCGWHCMASLSHRGQAVGALPSPCSRWDHSPVLGWCWAAVLGHVVRVGVCRAHRQCSGAGSQLCVWGFAQGMHTGRPVSSGAGRAAVLNGASPHHPHPAGAVRALLRPQPRNCFPFPAQLQRRGSGRQGRPLLPCCTFLKGQAPAWRARLNLQSRLSGVAIWLWFTGLFPLHPSATRVGVPNPQSRRGCVFLQPVGSPVGCSASLRPHSSWC